LRLFTRVDPPVLGEYAKEVNMVVLAVHLDRVGFEGCADVREDCSLLLDGIPIEHPMVVLGCQDRVDVDLECAAWSMSKIVLSGHQPMRD
jgi:hypothetical protein